MVLVLFDAWKSLTKLWSESITVVRGITNSTIIKIFETYASMNNTGECDVFSLLQARDYFPPVFLCKAQLGVFQFSTLSYLAG